MTDRVKVLAVAVSSNGLAAVYLFDRDLKNWRFSLDAIRTERRAVSRLREWIAALDPDVVITEDPARTRHKHGRTIPLLLALAQVAADEPVIGVRMHRVQRYRNKYAEAAALARHYPALAGLVPPARKFWKQEPRNVLYFEALAMALDWLDHAATAGSGCPGAPRSPEGGGEASGM